MAFECIVGVAQLVSPEVGAGTCPSAPGPNLACLQDTAYDNDLGSKGKQHCSKLSGLQWDLRRAFLKLKVCVAMVCAEEP